ncbi:MAG: 23S rRNA (uracil(1939)-C(5))-methyltransferase RlmD [Lachnospiraceae bacterium]|nr:MAG: 23S rRNA (uracil(1939)-C(5))-methyltransferase RlmD [Lachnospiraceae bacterium]
MKKGQICEGYVERLDFPNKGVLSCEDEKVVVKNVLPGQKISFMITKKRKGKAEGRLLDVLENAPYEIPSVCPHFGVCGGCAYQTLPYDKQLELKKGQVRKLLTPVFAKQALLDGEAELTDEYVNHIFEGIKGSPVQSAYRNKMEFSFGDEVKDGPLSLGMHKRGSFYDIVSVRECQLVDEDYRKILNTTLDYFTQKGTSYYHRMRHEGYLRHLLVRKAQKTGEILIALITTTQEEQDLQPYVDALLALPLQGKITGVLHTKNDSVADVVQSDETVLLYGQDYFYEELLGLKFKISQFSFFQTNSLGAEVLYETAREFLGDISDDGRNDKTVFDLYSGTGTIAQLLAPVAGRVIGVEIVEEAVKAARENAKLNNLNNCEFIAGDVLKVIGDIKEKPDFIVLDPPRDGIHPKALQHIIDYQVDRIVYISCKPTSLARDLDIMIEQGYRMERVVAIDQFPGTVHVETVVLLSKGEVDSKKIRVEFSLEDMDMSEFQDGATYPQIKEYVLEHTGLKVSNLYISQIKRKCGIGVGKNYNLPKSEDSRQPQCPQEKEKAIREAFKYFGMI